MVVKPHKKLLLKDRLSIPNYDNFTSFCTLPTFSFVNKVFSFRINFLCFLFICFLNCLFFGYLFQKLVHCLRCCYFLFLHSPKPFQMHLFLLQFQFHQFFCVLLSIIITFHITFAIMRLFSLIALTFVFCATQKFAYARIC